MTNVILFSENDKDIGEDSKVAHLYPSRTQKLSTLTPTIAKAKIGHCQYFFYAQRL